MRKRRQSSPIPQLLAGEVAVNMTVSIDASRDVPVVHIAGDLDHAAVPVVRAATQTLLDAGHRNLIFDLQAVTFLDSSGIGLCVTHHKILRARGGSLRLANVSSRVLSMLTMTGLHRVFQLYPTLDAALAVQEEP